MIKAVYPGSFDPVTFGHLDIITRASKVVDELIIGVLINQKKTPLFTMDERLHLLQEATKEFPNVTVKAFEGLTVEFAKENNARLIIRGLRAVTDFEYEIQMAQMNARLYRDNVETIFLMTNPQYSFISSSMIKEVHSLNGCVDGLIPEIILEYMDKKRKV